MHAVLRGQTLEQLKKHRLTAEASQDEQQLVDLEVIATLIEVSGLKPVDTVLEIGPGIGNITIELAKNAKKVYAVEKNPKFIPLLKERLKGGNAEIVLGNALVIYLPPFNVLVSNLPYTIVEATLQRLKRLRFRAAALLVPISFANILTAKRGKPIYSKLTLEANLFFHVLLNKVVKQGSYHPEPKTETAILTIKPKKVTDPNEAVLRQLLQQGDKKTVNALREALISIESYPKTKREAKEAVAKLELNVALLEKRVAALSLEDVELICCRLEENTI